MAAVAQRRRVSGLPVYPADTLVIEPKTTTPASTGYNTFVRQVDLRAPGCTSLQEALRHADTASKPLLNIPVQQ